MKGEGRDLSPYILEHMIEAMKASAGNGDLRNAGLFRDDKDGYETAETRETN
ncbi:hypothetical protein GLOTRDRAFT_109028 [Gloeophyllum trabeum ATCC 11539]|uniref:Uncharacterized protein n=1 Tax=Gloeophyllum trabeum (strain ATCC 11539 / FP-39264 / Madison 617) TaxID=670483 RepID=S7S412_GLOTA|nr:uncharacterized protein GLOTRDRAFT_109028 [Gloeophyllum trabeum ATCC 11539]EPQ60584.1 hypothetical protein GLOTRDRAFT_109028 [Gloeophyllum trabeum ATCC 11539]